MARRDARMQNVLSQHGHHLLANEVIKLLGTNSELGLDRFALPHRQAEFGSNQLTPRKSAGPWRRFLLQLHNPLSAGEASITRKTPQVPST